MQTSEQVNEIFAALAKAQGAMQHASKDSTNPHFNRSYADLASVWEACRGALAANGIGVVQDVGFAQNVVTCETMLGHSSGQWLKGSLSLPVVKADAQGVGSAVTYARRYSLAAMCGVAPADDDDGNAAVRPAAKAKPEPRTLADVARDAAARKEAAQPVPGLTAPVDTTPIPFDESQDPRTPEEIACDHIEALDGCRTLDDVAAWAKPRRAWFAALDKTSVAAKSLRESITEAAKRVDSTNKAVASFLVQP